MDDQRRQQDEQGELRLDENTAAAVVRDTRTREEIVEAMTRTKGPRGGPRWNG